MFKNFSNTSSSSGSTEKSNTSEGQDTEEIKKAKARKAPETEFTYDERDVMLYNLGIGAKASELPLVFEGADGFQVSSVLANVRGQRLSTCLIQALPTFGVIPQFGAAGGMDFDYVPNFNPVCMQVHLS
jgi:multifunctional beta-oxidation protein